jgi:hypothetical protein
MEIVQMIASAICGGVIVNLIKFVRFRGNDKASEIKTYADAEKSMAEAVKMKTEAELKIGAAWMEMAQKLQLEVQILREQLSHERDDCDRKMDSLRKEMMKWVKS